ncbi:MAG: hypothetical protein ACFFAO_13515, partial [Candidatus Hermodarchaeota archaeon]
MNSEIQIKMSRVINKIKAKVREFKSKEISNRDIFDLLNSDCYILKLMKEEDVSDFNSPCDIQNAINQIKL